jgi:hypothetical protein
MQPVDLARDSSPIKLMTLPTALSHTYLWQAHLAKPAQAYEMKKEAKTGKEQRGRKPKLLFTLRALTAGMLSGGSLRQARMVEAKEKRQARIIKAKKKWQARMVEEEKEQQARMVEEEKEQLAELERLAALIPAPSASCMKRYVKYFTKYLKKHNLPFGKACSGKKGPSWTSFMKVAAAAAAAKEDKAAMEESKLILRFLEDMTLGLQYSWEDLQDEARRMLKAIEDETVPANQVAGTKRARRATAQHDDTHANHIVDTTIATRRKTKGESFAVKAVHKEPAEKRSDNMGTLPPQEGLGHENERADGPPPGAAGTNLLQQEVVTTAVVPLNQSHAGFGGIHWAAFVHQSPHPLRRFNNVDRPVSYMVPVTATELPVNTVEHDMPLQ